MRNHIIDVAQWLDIYIFFFLGSVCFQLEARVSFWDILGTKTVSSHSCPLGQGGAKWRETKREVTAFAQTCKQCHCDNQIYNISVKQKKNWVTVCCHWFHPFLKRKTRPGTRGIHRAPAQSPATLIMLWTSSLIIIGYQFNPNKKAEPITSWQFFPPNRPLPVAL